MNAYRLTQANNDNDGCTVNQVKTPEMLAKTIASAELFGNRRDIVIAHAGEEYRLRITSNGKLILTK